MVFPNAQKILRFCPKKEFPQIYHLSKNVCSYLKQSRANKILPERLEIWGEKPNTFAKLVHRKWLGPITVSF